MAGMWGTQPQVRWCAVNTLHLANGASGLRCLMLNINSYMLLQGHLCLPDCNCT